MRLIFETFEIDLEAGRLLRDGAEVPLERRAFDLLCYLAEHPRRLIPRDELLAQVWQAHALSQGVLANTVAKLRKALGQPVDAQEPIETVRGRGYRWRTTQRRTAERQLADASGTADPFVGRAQALAQLSAALSRSAEVGGQLIWVTGEAGVGKTRLVRELEERARARGFAIWRGASHDGEAAPAYWPWVEILRAAHEQLGPIVWKRHLPTGDVALAELVPELCGKAANPRPPAQTLRFALFDQVTRFLKSASKQEPLLLVLEDLHWADAATIELLTHAARALERQPVLFLTTLRDRDVALDESASSALKRLARLATCIALQGLTNAEVAQLVDAWGGAASERAELVEALCARTMGNPLFIRQILALLVQRGPLLAASARALSVHELPLVVRSVIQQRIDLLGDAPRDVLAAAAVAGMEFDASMLAEVLGRSPQAVFAAIESAARLHVVEQRAPTLPHRFEFTHSLVCDALRDALGVARRGELHREFARVLSARGSAGDPRQLADLARHLLNAVPSDLDACVAACRNAATAARASSGFEVAASVLSRLVDKHESQGGDARERCELLLSLGGDQLCAGAFRNAWQTLRRGADMARLLEAPTLLAQFATRLARYLELGEGDETYVRSLFEQALRSLPASESDLRAALLAGRAELEHQRPFDDRRALLEEAEALAQQHASPGLLRHLAYARVVVHGPLCILERRKAVQRFRALDAQEGEAGVDPVRASHAFAVELAEYACAHTACDFEAAATALARGRALVASTSLRALELLVQLADAGRSLAAGRLDDVASHVQCIREAAEDGGLFGLAWSYYAARILIERGHTAALVDGSMAIDPANFQAPKRLRVPITLYRAWLGVQLGAPDYAIRALADIPRATLDCMPAAPADLGMLCALAETYHALGARAAAPPLLAQLEPFADLNAIGNNFECYGAVTHYLGLLARLLDRRGAAAAYFDRAIEANRTLQMPLLLARSEAQRAAC